MKISLQWLRDYVDVDASPEEIAKRLTLAGLEVEGVARLGDAEGVVVAEVLSAKKHPNADALTIVTVTDGGAPTEVVCGAPNVPAAGGKVAWAKPGARLPKLGVLEPKKIRGVVSPGMLCAEDELGLSEDHAGIIHLPADAKVGSDAMADLRDVVFEVNVTTNRPDCLGHIGIAREVAAAFGVQLKKPKLPELGSKGSPEAQVKVEDTSGCPRYIARVIEGLRVGPSPAWVQRRLRAVGVRPISNLVDATNYVLMEYGQPLHAFDYDKVSDHTIVVRRAKAGEKMKTLDGVERTLVATDLLICDASRLVAIAGVMGGAESEVSLATTRVLLESAYFDPYSIRRTSKRLGLHTEASHRFERGVDQEAGVWGASVRCAALLAEWGGGKVREGAVDVHPNPARPRDLAVSRSATRRLLGVDIEAKEMVKLLGSIELAATAKGDEIQVKVPTFRPDLTREVDLIEEVARLYGFDRIPATIPLTSRAPEPSGDPQAESARDALGAMGLDEAVTYGFVAPEKLAAAGYSGPLVRVMNPLREDTAVMRTTLVVGLLDALRTNLDRGNADVRLFEIGSVFLPRQGAPLPDERRTVGVLLCGRRESWLAAAEPFDFYDLKGVGERLLERLGAADLPWTQGESAPFLHPGVSARIGEAGFAGEVHPNVREKFGVEARCFYLELDLERLPAAAPVRFEALPRFPSIGRDVSFFIDVGVPAAAIAAAIRQLQEPLLVAFRVDEDYRDPQRVPAGKKSMLWSMTYRASDRTLTDAEASSAHEKVIQHLKTSFGISPR
jgi:phenylalanyl-tRNA synthetase beta chain